MACGTSRTGVRVEEDLYQEGWIMKMNRLPLAWLCGCVVVIVLVSRV